tara:strand:+ start:1120 stop:1833 length:714 start_codon:yes stop_codon:yes gene_type:complete
VPNSFFCALAFRRLNDWVPQVRDAAQAKLQDIVCESDSVHVVDALCATLPYWGSWKRMDESSKRALINVISNKRIAEALKAKIITATSGPLTSIFSQVGRTSALDEHIEEISVNAIQPAVRAKAYRTLLEEKMIWSEGRKWEWTDIRYCEGRPTPILSERKITPARSFLDTLRMASVDRSSIVRRVAAEMLIRKLDLLGREAHVLAELLASDSSPSVSERGRFALRRLTDKNNEHAT